jgi:2'-5' RNA ligase
MAYPMIITLELEAQAKANFTALRDTHFPRHSNYLEAHLTLFHRLPSDEPAITAVLKQLAERTPLQLEVNDVIHFGAGVAYTVASEELEQLHLDMQQAFDPWLIRQDRQPLRPHITIQNKVTDFKAKQLQEILRSSFRPYTIQATGFSTWYYLGGPWKANAHYPFAQTI